MSQSQKDSDAQPGQDSERALTREDSKKDIHDDENMEPSEPSDEDGDEDEDEESEEDSGPPKEELADREERICSVEAEAAAERAFGEMCPEDLKTTKITFAHYIDEADCIAGVHYKKLSLDVNMVCAFLLLVCMTT